MSGGRIQTLAIAVLASSLAGCGLNTEAYFPNKVRSKPGEIVYDS